MTKPKLKSFQEALQKVLDAGANIEELVIVTTPENASVARPFSEVTGIPVNTSVLCEKSTFWLVKNNAWEVPNKCLNLN